MNATMFKTISADNSATFDDKVKEMLDSGWEFHGYPYCVNHHYHTQCFVKYESTLLEKHSSQNGSPEIMSLTGSFVDNLGYHWLQVGEVVQEGDSVFIPGFPERKAISTGYVVRAGEVGYYRRKVDNNA